MYVPYCSGDTWLGIKKDRNLFLGDLFTNGHLILETVLDHLHNTTSMKKSVGHVLLSGDSAGGIGIIHDIPDMPNTHDVDKYCKILIGYSQILANSDKH